MGMSLDTGGKGKGAKPNINVTPLVDVVLVLLIIFMVVLPSVQDGKTIELVNVFHPEKDKDEDTPPVSVTVTRDAGYSIDQRDLSREALMQELRTIHATEPKRRVLLRGDASLPYETMRDLFRDCQDIGFGAVSLAVGKQREWKES